ALFEQFENEARSRGGKDEWEQNSMVRTERMLDQIQFFLENLQVCVVQTGKEEDAYTLFEVLNDRALSLNDLDIVKNYFYRTYVLQNSIPGQEGIVESTLDSMEELWSGRIFSDGTQEFLKSNTAYLGTIFLTGDKELTDVKGPRLRESIKGYLDRCGKSYSAGELSEDFRAFQLIQYFLKSCGITHQKKENAAIDSIANKDASEIKRAVLILQALGLTAVLPGIVSPAINRAMTNDDNDRESWLDKLINHDTAKASFPELEKFAFYLINYVLAANDYKRPRKLVSDHFIHDWRKGNSPQTPPWDLARPSSTEIGSFNEWSSSWQYSQKGPGFRLRALLTRLVRAQLHGDKLKMGMAFTEFPPAEKLQLDHLEPARANASHSNSYLQHPERQRLVNGLGNMMLIDSSNNIQKSNSPMRDCFAHLKAAGLNDNWLVNELRQLFDINCQTNAGGDKVPTAEFFVARGARLRSLMATVLNADFEEKELKVEMLD
ncbi:MAG: GmrSD restriction endonuclease domain-containing protein, partial [Oceanococcus sp.]